MAHEKARDTCAKCEAGEKCGAHDKALSANEKVITAADIVEVQKEVTAALRKEHGKAWDAVVEQEKEVEGKNRAELSVRIVVRKAGKPVGILTFGIRATTGTKGSGQAGVQFSWKKAPGASDKDFAKLNEAKDKSFLTG